MRYVLLCAALLCTACAGTEQPTLEPLWQQCESPNPELVLNGCTALIKSGHLKDWEMALAYTDRGVAHEERKNYALAIDDFNAALRYKPGYALAHVNRGNVYKHRGEFDKAIADLSTAIREQPGFAFAYVDRGGAHFAKGEYHKAAADFTKAIRFKPGLLSAYEARCVARGRLGQYKKALKDCSTALGMLPQVTTFLTKDDIKSLSLPGLDGLLKRFGILRNSQTADILKARGTVYYQMGDFKSAKADFQAALQPTGASMSLVYPTPYVHQYGVDRSEVDRAELLYLMGLAEAKLGDSTAANRDLAQAEKSKSDVAKKVATDYGIRSP